MDVVTEDVSEGALEHKPYVLFAAQLYESICTCIINRDKKMKSTQRIGLDKQKEMKAEARGISRLDAIMSFKEATWNAPSYERTRVAVDIYQVSTCKSKVAWKRCAKDTVGSFLANITKPAAASIASTLGDTSDSDEESSAEDRKNKKKVTEKDEKKRKNAGTALPAAKKGKVLKPAADSEEEVAVVEVQGSRKAETPKTSSKNQDGSTPGSGALSGARARAGAGARASAGAGVGAGAGAGKDAGAGAGMGASGGMEQRRLEIEKLEVEARRRAKVRQNISLRSRII